MKVSFGQVDGNQWEAFCQKILRLKYSDYQEVPAQFGGDLGIEGFTRTGTVFQCYCPDEDLTGNDLYEKQRDKITRDINKLVKNAAKISALGTGIVNEWLFITPFFNSRHLHEHCRAKEEEIKAKNLAGISANFKIFIKTEDDYIQERQIVVGNGHLRIHPSGETPEEGDINAFLSSGNKLVKTIVSKLYKLQRPASDVERARLTQLLVRDLLVGRQELETLNEKFPDVFRLVSQLKSAKEDHLETTVLTYAGDPGQLLQDTLCQYEQVLKDDFGMQMDSALISKLSSEAIADWLGRCPLDFPTQEAEHVD